jgi:hypothetical protein
MIQRRAGHACVVSLWISAEHTFCTCLTTTTSRNDLYYGETHFHDVDSIRRRRTYCDNPVNKDLPSIQAPQARGGGLQLHGSGNGGGGRSAPGPGRKPKFMDRVKGEAKVIVGKLSGKEEKVEEGKRMMGNIRTQG